jgi:hypothetical protein
MLFDVTCGQVCEDMELSCESVINGSASEVIGVGACDASTAAAIKARISFRRAVHRYITAKFSQIKPQTTPNCHPLLRLFVAASRGSSAAAAAAAAAREALAAADAVDSTSRCLNQYCSQTNTVFS